MEKEYFDKTLKKKMLEASNEKAHPNWRRMHFLLKENGLTKQFSILKNILLVSLAIITMINTGIIIHMLTGKTTPKRQIIPNTPSSNVAINIIDTIYNYDTIVSKKTVYVVDTIFVNKKVLIEKNNTTTKNKYLKQGKIIVNPKNITIDFQKHETVVKDVNKTNRYKKQTGTLSHIGYDTTSAVKEQLAALLKKSKNSTNGLQIKKHNITHSISSDTLHKKKNYTKDLHHATKETRQNNNSEKRERKHITASFFAGSLFNKLWIIDKDFAKGTTFQYGLIPSVLFNDNYEVYLGLLLCNNSYELKEDVAFKKTGNYPGITNTDSINEINATSKYYSFPIGLRYHINIGKHFKLLPELGIEYYLYKLQEFHYEYKENYREHNTIIIKNNSYTGFGHMSAGLGTSFVLFKKLHLILTPKYYFPIAKIGTEKMSYSMFSTEFMIMWQF